jgi:hypothetical protein
MDNRETNYTECHPITCTCVDCVKVKKILREYEPASLFKCSECGWKSLRYDKEKDKFICLNPACSKHS